jgi:glycosyltransferase involved in cell wall biosynthesis
MITICIPTRNRPQYLLIAIESVFHAFPDMDVDVIIGDNGDAAATARLLAESSLPSGRIRHLVNPPGSSYVDNLRRLVAAAEQQWLSILHDDDFFIQEAGRAVHPILSRKEVDFVFSDHFVADASGDLLVDQSEKNSELYGRTDFPEGPVVDIADAFVGQKVCLDGFFVRTQVAKAAPISSKYQVFADNLWMAEMLSRSNLCWFLKARLFAYRISHSSLTSRKESIEEMFSMLGDLAMKPAFLSQRQRILQKQRGVARVLTRRSLRDMRPVVALRWGWKWMASGVCS